MEKTPVSFGLNALRMQHFKSAQKNDQATQSVIQKSFQPVTFSGKLVTAEQYLPTMPNVRFMSLNSIQSKPGNKNTSVRNSPVSFGAKEVKTLRIEDYKPPTHLFDKTDLKFELNSEKDVVVSSKILVRPNPDSRDPTNVIKLSGEQERAPKMELLEVKINGRILTEKEYSRDGSDLIIDNLPDKPFNLEIKTRINPLKNETLEGLYVSDGLFTTQCESEGFRNMTFFLDRPDVMSSYTTTIVADKGKFPQMLSNGNPGVRKTLPDGREEITWTDPFKKPSYLFALVAGDLAVKEDTFKTMSGRNVKIKMYTDHGDEEKLNFAMQAIKDAMRWDEKAFGREYDLDLFQIVAVKDFNAGAMENKGLNIFQSSAVLADPRISTDSRYKYVQSVVGHEYFHNWTGDRVTLQKWFDLTLKEGLTVFRDQEFTADMNSRGVKRIDDANAMRTRQFPEDAGAMAHPIRPSAVGSMKNFYTSTVYNKGAEVIRMIHTMIGKEKFREAMDLYFKRHDGHAVTTEDFVQAMKDASGVDLTQFEKTWYNQAGTPTLDVTDHYDPEKQEYRITIKQNTPPTPKQPVKDPFHIPIRIGLVDSRGNDIPLKLASDQAHLLTNKDVLNLKEGETTFVFKDVPEKPVPSILRNWSAPVKLNYDYSREQLMFLMANDNDGFNRWEAGQKLGIEVLKDQVKALQDGADKPVDPNIIKAFKGVLKDKSLDNAMLARTLTLPTSSYLSGLYPDGKVDVKAIYNARKKVVKEIGTALNDELLAVFNKNRSTENRPYEWNKEDAGERAIKNKALSYLVNANPEKHLHLAIEQFDKNHNITDVRAALGLILDYGTDKQCQEALDTFYNNYNDEPQALYQWFQDQALADRPNVLDNVKKLLKHEKYEAKTPICVRHLLGGFIANTIHFHKEDGSGYKFIADQVIEADKFNSDLASGLAKTFESVHKYPPKYQALMKKELLRIKEKATSTAVQEVVTKTLEMLEAKQAGKES